jgi:hypothetical protein
MALSQSRRRKGSIISGKPTLGESNPTPMSGCRHSGRLAHAFAAIKDRTLPLSLVSLLEKIAAAVPRAKGRRKKA